MPLNNKWSITPELGFDLFDFSYSFSAYYDSKEIATNDTRSFHSSFITLGIYSDYQITDKTKLKFSMVGSIPTRIRYFNTSLLLSYNLYKKEKQELNVFGGVSYEDFYFRDSQKEMQNFMKHRIPSCKIGLEYKF